MWPPKQKRGSIRDGIIGEHAPLATHEGNRMRGNSLVAVDNSRSCNFCRVYYGLSRVQKLEKTKSGVRTGILDILLRDHSAERHISFDIKSGGEPHLLGAGCLATCMCAARQILHTRMVPLFSSVNSTTTE